MRLYIAGIAVAGCLIGSIASAQEKSVIKVAPGQEQTSPILTPEMRAYLDELQRRDEPKQNAIRAAMVKAEQRRARLASQAWYGYSNLRPIANPFPITSSYSPHWAGGYNDFTWYGATTPLYYQQSIIYTR
jgi:hypothetical protein